MRKRSVAFCAVLAVIICVTQVRSEEAALPKTMIGFLRPGMRVGIQSVEGTTNVKIDAYAEDQYKIALDVAGLGRQTLDAAKFAGNRPGVQKELDVFIERLIKKAPDADTSEVIVFPLFRTLFGTVVAVGDDYVLIDREGTRKRRLVLARSSVAQIDLDANALRFSHRSMR